MPDAAPIVRHGDAEALPFIRYAQFYPRVLNALDCIQGILHKLHQDVLNRDRASHDAVWACLKFLARGDLSGSLAQRSKELFPEGQELDSLLFIHVHTGIRPHGINHGLLPCQDFLGPLNVFPLLFIIEEIKVLVENVQGHFQSIHGVPKLMPQGG